MKRILSTVIFSLSLMAIITSCNKEYTCECDNGNFSQIIEASSQSDASAECSNKGNDCTLK